MQTAGGAVFEKDCVCTTIDVEPKAGTSTGDATALNSCRKLAPTGEWMNATGQQTIHFMIIISFLLKEILAMAKLFVYTAQIKNIRP